MLRDAPRLFYYICLLLLLGANKETKVYTAIHSMLGKPRMIAEVIIARMFQHKESSTAQ